MKFTYLLIAAMLVGAGWMLFVTVEDPLPLEPTQQIVDLTGKSSDPESPQQVGEEPQEISGKGPAPALYLQSKPESTSSTSMSPKPGPQVMDSSGKVNPDAIEYYRKAGLLGASSKALAVLKGQPELWESVEGSKGLGFCDSGTVQEQLPDGAPGGL